MQIQQAKISDLAQYATVPISFMVNAIVEVSGDSPESFTLSEHPVSKPWLKDYDAYNSPLRLPARFDLSNWAIFLASDGVRPVGGCIVAYNTPGVGMLQGRSDLAVLWDIRIAPNYRGRSTGRCLFETSIAWARSCGCVELHVETQNINVPACHFYQSMGCTLLRVVRDAYDKDPDEHQLIWYRVISRDSL
ncbi:MAG: GNAT family N-acetyltransferase [Cyanobacteria bacterium P01_D01_bin.56]